MKTIAVFNNRGDVGATILVYHLAWMFAELGLRVVAADVDPQADLTAMSLPTDTLAAIENDELASIYDAVAPAVGGTATVAPQVCEVTPGFGLLPGDLDLSFLEEALAVAWAESRGATPRLRSHGMRGSTALARAIRDAAVIYGADLVLIDVGPNLGAITRAALLGADYVVVPVTTDMFALKGLTNAGRALQGWRADWSRRVSETPLPTDGWPIGAMKPLGYVILRLARHKRDDAYDIRRWIDRIPDVFHRDMLEDSLPVPPSLDDDPAALAWLKDYHALMAMARESRKPMFLLKPADGAIGGHQQAVLAAYAEFKALALGLAARTGIALIS